MKFATWVFRIAGIYGLLVMAPQYFMEESIARDTPPAITHPEFFYGFIGVAVAWQLAFLTIASDPVRYRPMMLPAMVEKATFAIAAVVLFAQQRLSGVVLGFGMLDGVLGVLFALAYWKTADTRRE